MRDPEVPHLHLAVPGVHVCVCVRACVRACVRVCVCDIFVYYVLLRR